MFPTLPVMLLLTACRSFWAGHTPCCCPWIDLARNVTGRVAFCYCWATHRVHVTSRKSTLQYMMYKTQTNFSQSNLVSATHSLLFCYLYYNCHSAWQNTCKFNRSSNKPYSWKESKEEWIPFFNGWLLRSHTLRTHAHMHMHISHPYIHITHTHYTLSYLRMRTDLAIIFSGTTVYCTPAQ